jgi:hypothetical protein
VGAGPVGGGGAPISSYDAGHGRPPDATDVEIDGPPDGVAAGHGRGAPSMGTRTTGAGRGPGSGLPTLDVLGAPSNSIGAAKKRFKMQVKYFAILFKLEIS